MSSAGNITIEFQRQTDVASDKNPVEITSNRRTDIAKFLTGKSASEAIKILPMIFSICGMAHAQAAQKVFGQYHNDSELTVLCENAREHLLRIFTGWNLENNTEFDQINFDEVIGLVSKMQIAIKNDRTSIVQISRTIDDFLYHNIFHCQPQDWLNMSSDEELAIWAEHTTSIAGCFIDNIYRNNWQSIGSIEPDFLPDIPAGDLSEKMHGAEATPFIAQPKWSGCCYETGPLARNSDHPLISALAGRYGYGILTRQIARLIDLAKTPSAIEQKLKMPNTYKNITGFGQVETARGRLTHSAIVDHGVIADYKILAPTEWNFHPAGALFKSLQSLPASGEIELRSMAGMIIEAIDPCVAFQVRVH